MRCNGEAVKTRWDKKHGTSFCARLENGQSKYFSRTFALAFAYVEKPALPFYRLELKQRRQDGWREFFPVYGKVSARRMFWRVKPPPQDEQWKVLTQEMYKGFEVSSEGRVRAINGD